MNFFKQTWKDKGFRYGSYFIAGLTLGSLLAGEILGVIIFGGVLVVMWGIAYLYYRNGI